MLNCSRWALIIPFNKKRLQIKPNTSLKNCKITNPGFSLYTIVPEKTGQITVLLIDGNL